MACRIRGRSLTSGGVTGRSKWSDTLGWARRSRLGQSLVQETSPPSWYRILTVKSLILYDLTILGTARLAWFPDRYRYFLLRVSICLSHEDGRMWATTAAVTPVWESCHAADAWATDLGLTAQFSLLQPLVKPWICAETTGARQRVKKEILCYFFLR